MTPLAAASNSLALTPSLGPFATTCLHTRGLKPQISPTSPQKAASYREMMTLSYSSGNLSPPPRHLIAATAARANSPLMTPYAPMCRSWPDRESCTYAKPMPLATSVSHAHSNAGTLLLVGRYASLHQMVGTTLPQVSCTKNLSPNNSLAYTLHPLAQQPRNIRQR